LSFLLAVGAGPGPATGFKYYKKPGAFKEYIDKGSAGKFYGFWASLVNAVFAYLGTELIGVTVGEAQNPRKTIPRAIKLTFYRILFFYCLAVFFLGMLVPYDSKQLAFANTNTTRASASPFVLAIRLAGIKHLPGILNACILLFTFSASNSDLYIASRTLYGLAESGHAPKIFRWTDKRGVPVPALALSALFCCTAFMNAADDLTPRHAHLLRACAQRSRHHQGPDGVHCSLWSHWIIHCLVLLLLDRFDQELPRFYQGQVRCFRLQELHHWLPRKFTRALYYNNIADSPSRVFRST
jgi:amino acid permease